MKLFDLFNDTQEELYKRLEPYITAKTSAVWIAENVNGIGVLEKSDIILIFFEEALMCVSERCIKTDWKKNAATKKILMENSSLYREGLRSTFTEGKEYYELVAFMKGWYEWLDS